MYIMLDPIEPTDPSKTNQDDPGHIPLQTSGPKLGEITGPRLRFTEPLEEKCIEVPTENADSEGDYELDDGTSLTPAPELPTETDVQAFTASVNKLVSQLMKKSASRDDALTSEVGSVTDGVSPRIIEQNVALFAKLFEKGRALLSQIHPRYFSVQTSEEAPYTALKHRAEKMERYLETLTATEQSLGRVFVETPEQLRTTFYESVVALCGEDTTILQSDSLQIYRIYEQARWKLIADATGATRGLRAPEPATGGGGGGSNSTERSKADSPATSDSPPKPKKKVLNYGRPSDNAPSPTPVNDSVDNASEEKAPSTGDDEQAPPTAAELAEQGRNDYKAELLKSDIAAHRKFMAGIRAGKEQKHALYGKLQPAFLKLVNDITDRDDQAAFIDGTIGDIGNGLVSWLQSRIGFEHEEGETLPTSYDQAKIKCRPTIDRFFCYSAVEPEVKTLAALLRLVNCEEHLPTEGQNALKHMAPSAADITVREATPEMQRLVAERNRERQIEEKLTLLAKQALVRHANDRDMRLANGEDGRWKIAMRIAKQQLEESGWQPQIKE